MADTDIEALPSRIKLLEAFIEKLRQWNALPSGRHLYGSELAETDRIRREIESWINLNAVAVDQVVRDAGIPTGLTVYPPPAVGGVVGHVNVIRGVFREVYLRTFEDEALRCAEQALGVYQHMRDATGLVRRPSQPESLDVVAAIQRALRPAFRPGPPNNERDVQDRIEVILRSLGIDISREQEVAPVGARSSRPDFTLNDLDTALEVKFANERHSESEVQEEIMTDFAAYKTKWKHVLFVVYDMGVIHDPDRMIKENTKHFGVTVLIVKH